MANTFPSGVVFDSLEVDQEHSLLYVSLPSTGKLHVRDVKYISAIASGLGLLAVVLSTGEFTAWISMTDYDKFSSGELTQDDFIKKWVV